MDFHKLENITVEDVKNAHMADEAIQEKYGVKYHQFWINVEAGTVFCLTEGPDMATCEKVHQIAHGNIACAMTEVEPGFYQLLMGETAQVDHGVVKNSDGSIDLGYRNILVVSVQGVTDARTSKDLNLLQPVSWIKDIVSESVARFNGREVRCSSDDGHISVFEDTDAALGSAQWIQRRVNETSNTKPQAIVRMGISAGQPVTEDGEFFTQAISRAQQLSILAPDNQILGSSLVKKLSQANPLDVRLLTEAEEDFAIRLLETIEKQLQDENFRIDDIGQSIAVSRPQLYRKITAITGRSPNDFIRDLRMAKAISLLKAKKHNITQVALEVGYASPSYFAKCFVKKFGCTPSEFATATV